MAKQKITKYDTHIKPYFDEILGWLRSGHTEGSIAERLGVSDESWTRYKKLHVEFLDIIKEGGQKSTALVVNKLFQRATGYEFDEVATEIKVIGGEQRKTVKKTTKHIAPDVGAIAIYLFNRDKKNWQNKQHIEHSGEIENRFSHMTDEELKKRFIELGGKC